jgi:hypothetical protein
MPYQNRVTPFGEIIATAERGTLFGNRGILHDAERRLGRRRWTTKAWLACQLAFKGRRRMIMAPHRYTELFFHDEATAFAAGHRPCGECRRADYAAFTAAWRQGNGRDAGIDEIDAALHAERLGPHRTKRTFHALVGDLPDGVFVELYGEAWLLWQHRLWRWTPGGYGASHPADGGAEVLTPRSTVAAFRAGYRPSVLLP